MSLPKPPEWVNVWFWLRFLRNPRILTPLLQQELHSGAMAMDEYEHHRQEWISAGAPATSTAQIAQAMGINEEFVPF